MGGAGSGNWYRWDTKDTADSQLRVDIRDLRRSGYFQPGYSGSLSWSCGDESAGSIRFRVTEGYVHLVYHQKQFGGEWESVVEPVPITWTACHYGGKRPWFRCPLQGCGRRVAVLYGAGKYFGCRHCYELVYQSQRETAYERATRKCRKIVQRLGGDPDADLWPDRPRGMHRTTYDRLLAEAQYYDEISYKALLGLFAKYTSA